MPLRFADFLRRALGCCLIVTGLLAIATLVPSVPWILDPDLLWGPACTWALLVVSGAGLAARSRLAFVGVYLGAVLVTGLGGASEVAYVGTRNMPIGLAEVIHHVTIGVFVIALASVHWSLCRSARRWRNGRCANCGYELHPRAGEGCSECGWRRTWTRPIWRGVA